VKTISDGFGRTIETDTGYSTTTVSIVKTNYAPCGCSPLGQMSQISEPYAPGGTPVYTTYNYDGMGRTTSTVAPDGSTTTYTYNGNTVQVTDPAGHYKIFTMDAFGNLIQVSETDPSLGGVTTTYTYDMLNHLTGVSMPRGSTTQTRSFKYTNGTTVGAVLLSTTNPENGTVNYTYDSYMRLSTKTDAKGQVFTYSYDSYNRLTQISQGGNVLRTYVYDSNTDNPSYSGLYTHGRLAEIKYPAINFVDDTSGSAGTTQFTDMFSYTPAGQVAGKLLQVNKTRTYLYLGNYVAQPAAGSLALAYTYNNEGKLTNITYPTDANNTTPQMNYTYDSMARLAGATDQSSNSVVSGVAYNAASQLTNITYYGTAESRSYNSLMQLIGITAGSAINISYNYTAGSNNGKIASTSDAISGETVTYQYDSLNRLISASGSGWSQTQAYDGFGNLSGRTGTASGTTISTPANQSTDQLSGYSYDANGNLISSGYTYDPENRITFANNGGVAYSYDAQNKRVWQATCNPSLGSCGPGVNFAMYSETITMFGADGKQLASYTPVVSWNNTQTQLTITFTTLRERTYFGGKLVGQLSGGTMQSTVQDRLGSVGKYYPYGEERNSPQLLNDMVKFATYTRDSATGNDYADQRYYTSALGRFVSPDPARNSAGPGDPGSWNRYSYTRGDPINRMDPSGLDDCSTGATFCITVTEATPPMPVQYFPYIPDGLPSNDFYSNTESGISDTIGLALANIAQLVESIQFAQAQSAFQNAATLIAGTKNWSANCEQDFTALGLTDSAVEAGASNAQFLDGVGSSATMASLYAGASNPRVGQLGALLPGTVGQDIATNPMGVVADAQLGGNLIYLNGTLISALLNGNYPAVGFDVTSVTLHELVHNLTGLTDPDIQRALGLSQGGVSDNISQKLKADCFPQ